MFCTQCGHKLPDEARFCTKCGCPMTPSAPEPEEEVYSYEQEPTVSVPPAAPDESPETFVEPEEKPKKGKKLGLFIALVLVLALGAGGGYYAWQQYNLKLQCEELISQAQEYIQDGRYDRAQECYEELISLDADNKDAILALAQTQLHQHQYDDAEKTLESIAFSETDSGYAQYQTLRSLSQFNPEIDSVNTDNFPKVTVTMTYTGDLVLDAAALKVEDNGAEREVEDFSMDNGVIRFTYQSDDAGYTPEDRDVALELTAHDVVFQQDTEYTSPHFTPAQVQLISTDISEYPVVKTYFRVENPDDGQTIADLNTNSFIIWERVEGGDYLAREVRSVVPLKGNLGLNIALVADKSGSISYSDMNNIKQVMSDFVRNLHFDVGDKAEVLAFDSIVQQMCYYTNNSTLLINGINNMSPDGLTAFYDAVYTGIHHASLQGGARCVVAFTDGIDNESRHTANEVVRYANDMQVPVYIIGVGSSVEANTLTQIARNTGGRYWFIDDLYDLAAIFDEVYAEQKELYAVEYISDESLDQFLSRELEVTVTGGGFKGENSFEFEPVPTIQTSDHTSRYELFKGAYTWEEAAQKCQEMGGHLATITSQDEMDQLIAMAEAEDVRYIWLGGYTSYNEQGDVFGHWLTGEEFTFSAWSANEPSRIDADGAEEWYIMLWDIPAVGGWCWNDQRNDPNSAVGGRMGQYMGYICEFEY